MSTDDSGIGFTNTGGGHALDGTFIVYDVAATANALKNHEWASLALLGVTDTLDVAATASDPIGTLLGAGLGWLMDHLNPLKKWLDELTGDSGAVEAFAGTWEGVGSSLKSSAEDLGSYPRNDLSEMSGATIASYLRLTEKLRAQIEALSESAEGMAGSLKYAATLVEAVHGLVRDTLAQLVGAAISWAGEEFFSLGLATGWVIEQVSTRVSALASRVGNTIRELINSCHALASLVNKLDAAVGKVREVLDHVHPDVARGKHSTPWLNERHPSTGGAGRHRGPIDPLHNRVKNVIKTEVPRDAIGEGAAAGSNRTKHPEER